MTTLAFPDTAGQPTDGSFTYEANGVIYSWTGDYWAANNAQGFDHRYVNVDGDQMTGDLTVPSLNGGPLGGMRNYFINANFRVLQRNTLSTDTAFTNDDFGPDRWYLRGSTAVGGTVTAAVNTRSDANYCLRMKYNGATAGAFLQYKLEAQDVQNLIGETFIISMGFDDYSNTASPSVVVREVNTSGTGTNLAEVPFTLNAATGRYEAKVTSAYSATRYGSAPNEVGMSVTIWVNGSGTAPANGSYDFWDLQMEKGAVATPFEYRPIGTELAMCQRYFYVVPTNLAIGGYGDQSDTNRTAKYSYAFPVVMRTTPTKDKNPGISGTNVSGTASFVVRNASHADVTIRPDVTGTFGGGTTEPVQLDAEL